MTTRSQVDYTHWRCPDCLEVISTLARRSTLPCPKCRSEMVPVDGSPETLERRVTRNGHAISVGGLTMSDHTVDDYALRCAADALLRHEEPNAVTDEIRRTHGYPLPMRGPTYTRAEVVVRAYVEALNGGRP